MEIWREQEVSSSEIVNSSEIVSEELIDKAEKFFSWEFFSEAFFQVLFVFVLKLVIALVIFFIGLKLIKYLLKLMRTVFENSQIDVSISTFLLSLTSLLLKTLLIITIAVNLGAEMSTVVAVIVAFIGTVGLAIGLALQGSLSNFAGGVLILFLKPFKIGDYIEEHADGYEGFVEKIEIFYTTLKTRDNKAIVIPNGLLSNNSITNYSAMKQRRVEVFVGISYNQDIRIARKAILDVIRKSELILLDPEPIINVDELADSSVNLKVLVWCKTDDYLLVRAQLLENIKIKLDEENIEIPFPQMDVHMINKK